MQDPRVVPLARTADLFLPVRPGTDSALFGAVLHELIRNDWLDHDFIDAHTVDFDQAAAAAAEMTPTWAAEITGVPAGRIQQAAEWWGTSATGMLLQQDIAWLADALYVIAAVGYVVLGAMLALRVVLFPRPFWSDATDHARGFAFLTVVAGTNVLGSASGIVHGWWDLAWVLWWVSLPLYAVLLYITLIAVVVGSEKPGLDRGLNGTWFLLVVATQSVAVLGALLLGRHDSDLLAFTLLAAFGLGLVLYLIVMTLIFMRWSFDPLAPLEASPPAWIAAGAVAITVLAGSNILLGASDSDRIERVVPFIEGMTILAWGTATFWFPLMIAIGVWRHLVKRVPLRYEPSYWALVFPIGMYGASTFQMRRAIELDALGWLPKVSLVAAMLAWTATFIGLLHTLGRGIRNGGS